MVFKSQKFDLKEDPDIFEGDWIKETNTELRKGRSLLDHIHSKKFTTKLKMPSDYQYFLPTFENLLIPFPYMVGQQVISTDPLVKKHCFGDCDVRT